MYIKDFFEKYKNDRIKLFVDMDGVIADYDVGKPSNYDEKRPLFSNISKLDEISKEGNIELYILSVCRMTEGIEQKNCWLDKYAPFFKKENRVILDRESNNFKHSKDLKVDYIKSLIDEKFLIAVIDDDCQILKELNENVKDIILLKDTALVD